MSEGAHPGTDVVVVTYQSAAHLPACLEALPSDVSLVVVDNASSDGSAEIAERCGAQVVRNDDNRGFAAAANQGARLGGSELLLFLNPDAVVGETDLRTLERALLDDPRTGAVAPRLAYAGGSIQRTWWPFPSAAGTWREAIGLHRLRPAGPGPDGAVPYLIGACLFVRRRAFEEVGGFDESFWLYGEDADLGMRLRRLGWTSRFVPTATAHHIGGASGDRDVAVTFEHFQRGAERFIAKHHGQAALAAHRVGLLVGSLVRIPVLALRRDEAGRARCTARRKIVRRLVGVLVHGDRSR